MREDDINLIQSQAPQKKVIQTFLTITATIFAFIFVIGAALLIFSIVLSGQSSGQLDQISDIRRQIASDPGKKDKMLITSERLTDTRSLLDTRNGVEKTASLIYSLIPASFSINTLNADGVKITIILTGDNLSDFSVFLGKTIPDFISKNKGLVTAVEIESFVQGQGGYQLSINFKLTGTKI